VLVVAAGSALVLKVHGARHVSEVFKPIVRPVSISVIHLLLRPLTCHIEPRKTVGEVRATINVESHITDVVSRTDGGAGRVPVVSDSPRKQARLRVVVKKFAQTLRGKILNSHEAVLSLIGQRPARVASTARASLF
jgi:hypothetical protein